MSYFNKRLSATYQIIFSCLLLFSTPAKPSATNQQPGTHQDIAFHHQLLAIQNTNNNDRQTIDFFKKHLQGLNHHDIIQISASEFEQDQKRIQTKPFPRYSPPPTPQPKSIPINKIHFMQNSAWPVFTDQKHNVFSTSKNLKSRALSLNVLPKIHVWQDQQHQIWTLDHRRLAAMTLAGNIKKTPVVWATKTEVNQSRSRFTTKNNGQSILIYLTQRLGVVISPRTALEDKKHSKTENSLLHSTAMHKQ